MRCVRTPRRILFQARSAISHEASLTKVFIAAWKNYPRRLFATLAMRYNFSERLSAPAAASSRNNMFTVDRKGLLMFVMLVIDSNACEEMFGIKINPSFIWTTWQCYTVIKRTLKNGLARVYQNLWRTLYLVGGKQKLQKGAIWTKKKCFVYFLFIKVAKIRGET